LDGGKVKPNGTKIGEETKSIEKRHGGQIGYLAKKC